MFYIYDGTFEGFLSAVTLIMRVEKDVSADRQPFFGILRDSGVPPLLEYQIVPVLPGILFDFGNYIHRNFGELMTKTIYHAFLSEDEGIENAITDYIFLARKCHCDPIDQLYQDCVKKVADAAKTVTREAHHYLGLLRFRKLKSTVPLQSEKSIRPDHFCAEKSDKEENSYLPLIHYSIADSTMSAMKNSMADLNTDDSFFEIPEIFIAECEPVTCSLPLIAEHFVKRLPNQLFIIFDRRRKICVIHIQGDVWTMAPYDPATDLNQSFDSSFEKMWQTYFKVLAIPERINPKLQQGNMPKRYWKYLIEHPGK